MTNGPLRYDGGMDGITAAQEATSVNIAPTPTFRTHQVQILKLSKGEELSMVILVSGWPIYYDEQVRVGGALEARWRRGGGALEAPAALKHLQQLPTYPISRVDGGMDKITAAQEATGVNIGSLQN
ncbi:hypothetical protein DFH09DRAFT_1077404 [Mycena vulgaris]|nr:hypothetical protein DFH09DRAFT_1077404 [Mycena vulgaris]